MGCIQYRVKCPLDMAILNKQLALLIWVLKTERNKLLKF